MSSTTAMVFSESTTRSPIPTAATISSLSTISTTHPIDDRPMTPMSQDDEDSMTMVHKRHLSEVSYEHLDKRPRWSTIRTMRSSRSMDSNMSTKTEASQQDADWDDADFVTTATNTTKDDTAAMPKDIGQLVQQMEHWSLMNLKEWRRQESMSTSSNSSCENHHQKKFRMAKSEMFSVLRQKQHPTTGSVL